MKKILIATSALVALSATSAFAIDVTTSGSVEYRYTKDKEHSAATNTAQAQNAKLSRKTANVKFAASAASDGLAYGAYVTVKSNDGSDYKAGSDAARAATLGAQLETNQDGDNRFLGWTQGGRAVFFVSEAGNNDDGFIVGQAVGATGPTSGKPANNATTESAMWLSGVWGKLVVGQSGNAAGLAPSGAVSAASFVTGTEVAESSAGQKASERVTYSFPTFVEGLQIQYTHSFKGNTSTAKTDRVKAPTNWGIQYAADLMAVGVKVGYASGTTGVSGERNGAAALDASEIDGLGGATVSSNDVTTPTYTRKSRTNTAMGVEVSYGNFTVGYGVFNNEKRYWQTKDTDGSAMGVKYNGGAWSVGYTVKKSDDTNQYYNGTYSSAWNKSASTSAISAAFTVAEGFSVYASRSTNTVKRAGNTTGTATLKNNYTIIGGKIAF